MAEHLPLVIQRGDPDEVPCIRGNDDARLELALPRDRAVLAEPTTVGCPSFRRPVATLKYPPVHLGGPVPAHIQHALPWPHRDGGGGLGAPDPGKLERAVILAEPQPGEMHGADVDVAECLARGGELGEGRGVAPADEDVTIAGELLHGALGRDEQALGGDVVLEERGRHVVAVEGDEEAATVLGRGKLVVGPVVEDGQGVVRLGPGGVVLPCHVGRGAVGEVGEVVARTAQLPEDVAGGGVDVGNAAHVPGRNEVVAGAVLVDTVDMEEVEGVVFDAKGSDGGHALGNGVVVRRSPLEDQFTGFYVGFLEEAVDDPPVVDAVGGQVEGHLLVDGEEGRVLVCDAKLVEITSDAPNGGDVLEDVIRRVELARSRSTKRCRCKSTHEAGRVSLIP